MKLTEATVVLLDVARPQLFAGKVERLQNSRPSHHPDGLAVGDWRGRRHVLLLDADIAAAKALLPEWNAARAVHAPQIQVVALCHVQEDAIAPDDRRRPGECWQRQRPGTVVAFRPANRQVPFAAEAVQRPSAPLRPVVSRWIGSRRIEQDDYQSNPFSHRLVHRLPAKAGSHILPSNFFLIPRAELQAAVR